MQTMRPQGDLGLSELIADLPDNCIMAEIGCFAGESTAFFAAKASLIYAIDPWEDYTDTTTLTQSYHHHIKMDGVETRFDAITAKLKSPSNEAINLIPDSSLDAVYIDGDHSYEKVHEDIRLWIAKIKPDGIISGHDWGLIDITTAVRETIGEPHKTYPDNSWAKRLPSQPQEYQAAITTSRQTRQHASQPQTPDPQDDPQTHQTHPDHTTQTDNQ